MRGKAPSLPRLQPSFNTCTQSTGSSSWSSLSSLADLTQPLSRESSPVQVLTCQQAGERQTWPLFIVSLCCYFDPQTSPLEGFADLLPPSGGFATFSPCLAGLWPVTPWHKETWLAWGRGERGCSSTRCIMMGWTWGEEAPIGSHVIGRSSLEDAVKEVLQICGVGRTCGRLWGRPESESGKVQRSFVLEPHCCFCFYRCSCGNKNDGQL